MQQQPLRIGSLFSGYGGLDLAVEQVTGARPAWFVEYDKAPSRILAQQAVAALTGMLELDDLMEAA